jgi:hypothetical protein
VTGQPTRDADWGRKDESAVVDKGNRYGAELDSPEVVDDDRLNWGVIVVVLALLIVVYAVAWFILTTSILGEPTDEPAESPSATTGQIPTAVLFVHGRSARVVAR